jgi:hypothetical protein
LNGRAKDPRGAAVADLVTPLHDDGPLRPPSKRAIALALIGLFPYTACATHPVNAAKAELSPVAPIESDRARAEETAELVSRLREDGLGRDRFFVPHVLYTWTRAEQIQELRDNPVLLTRGVSTGGQMSGFDHAIAEDRSALARHLRSPRWTARRFAWPNPWATRMGWPNADYGDRLVRMELRRDAWVARFDPEEIEGPRWEVRDREGTLVPAREVANEPWRVAAVYHFGRGPGPDGSERVFREYVVVSEGMLERWCVSDAVTLARLARDREMLRVLADRIEHFELPPPVFDRWSHTLLPRWRGESERADLVALYESGLALGSELYLPTPANLRNAAAALAIPPEDPLSHAPERPRIPAPVPQPIVSYPHNAYHGVW